MYKGERYSNQLTYEAYFFTVVGSWSAQRKPTHAQKEFTNSTQKQPRWDSNLRHLTVKQEG